MVWILLGAAILCEVAATVSLRLSNGLTNIVPTIVVVLGYLASFGLLAYVLKHGMPLGVAYGIWAGVGVALIALIGTAFLGDRLTWIQVIGLVLVVAGVIAIKMGEAR
ncbi:DMT family transporter [Rhodococcus sp. NPDC057014]|uniref:DMT family transporter n=1 Tax=Rhodococcus sp. NPDC057014 TaxID=3346000 RepID=UPI003645F3D9